MACDYNYSVKLEPALRRACHKGLGETVRCSPVKVRNAGGFSALFPGGSHKPFVFTNLKAGGGVGEVIRFVRDAGMLD